MNDKKRSLLIKAISYLNQASELVSAVLDSEEDTLYNMPDNLQASERYYKIETAISNLEEAGEGIENIIESIELASE